MNGREPAAETDSRAPLPRLYVVVSVLTLALAALASATGVFVPGFYRDAAVLVPQARGQDLLTLFVALPALAVSLVAARRGSLRGYVLWLGVTGYLLYTYASYAVMTAFNELYLVYVGLFGLTLYTLVGGVTRLDAAALKRSVGDHSTRPYVVYQLLLAGLVAALWLSEDLPAVLTGRVPESVAAVGLPVNPIHSLDLGVVLPAFVVSALLLRRGRAWGYAFTGILLVKGTTLGLALLSMIAFMLRDGQSVALPEVVVFGALSLAGLSLTARFLLAVDGNEATTEAVTGTGTGRPAGAAGRTEP